MKRVLMLDPSPICRDYLKEKLATVKISVDIAQGHIGSFARLTSLLPDLIVIDVDQDFSGVIEFLERKRTNPNTISTPAIVIGPPVNPETMANLVRSGVTKYFVRPFMMDMLVNAMATLLMTSLDMDPTPCTIEAHKNKNAIVVEVSRGLNLDKIALLKFHLADLISNHTITSPKILLILFNLDLGFVDGVNLEKLFDSVICAPRVTKKEIKVLTTDPFIAQFIEGHSEYSGIQAADALTSLLNAFVESSTYASWDELVVNKLLNMDKNTIPCYTDMTFKTELETRKQEIQLNRE